MELRSKVAVVTGAGTGIGRATAIALAGRGVRVALSGRREEPLEQTADELRSQGHDAVAMPCDVRDAGRVEALIGEVQRRFDRLDILINNAGVTLRKPLVETTADEWRALIDTNVTGVFLGCRAAAPVIAAGGGGLIVNVSSVLGLRGQDGFTAYSASKFAVIGLTESLAQELEPASVRVVAICPDATNTPLHAANVGDERARQAMDPKIVAERIVDVASGDIALATGAHLVVGPPAAPPPLATRVRRRLGRLVRGFDV